MPAGLATTFDVLKTTDNEAAVGALLPALDSPHQWIQEEALVTLLERRSPSGQREVLRRLHQINDRWLQIVGRYQGRMSAALREAVLGDDRQTCMNGCEAILWFREYDLLPVLINVAQDRQHANGDKAAATLAKLSELLYDEIHGPRDYRQRRDPLRIRQHVMTSLENSVQRYPQHHRREIVEAFLSLVTRENQTLQRLLADPHEASYLVLVDVLTHSTRRGVMQLGVSFFEDSRAPTTALRSASHRIDPPFLQMLLSKIASSTEPAVILNLRKLHAIPCLAGDLSGLLALDDLAQQGAVRMAMVSAISRQAALEVVAKILLHGHTGARRAAAFALAQFSGLEANELAVQAMDDPDPKVQASIVLQLRRRGIPGAVSRLVEKISSPHEGVRMAVRESLSEFSLDRFLASFDILEEEARIATGALVRKIDDQLLPGLAAEMGAPSRLRRIRAIAAAQTMRIIPELELPLLALLRDVDHIVRAEAASALVDCDTPEVRGALTEALADRSVTVRDAARESLAELNEASGLRVTQAWRPRSREE